MNGNYLYNEFHAKAKMAEYRRAAETHRLAQEMGDKDNPKLNTGYVTYYSRQLVKQYNPLNNTSRGFTSHYSI